MKDEEILKLWKSGLNKNQVAKRYMRQYNQRIKIIRLDIKHRNERFITYYEALARVEKLILKEIKEGGTNDYKKRTWTTRKHI